MSEEFYRPHAHTMCLDPDNEDPSFDDGYASGAAVAFGLMGMAEAIRAISQTGRCHECGYDQQVPHPNADYSGDLYPCTDGYIYCGWCADRLEKRDAGEAFPGPPWRLAPPSRSEENHG